jgi:hypothetical protein
MSPSRRLALLAMLLLAAGAAGCGFLRDIFGEEEGYLFAGRDVLAVPGEEVAVRARLQSGGFLRDKVGVPVRFEHGGRLLGEVLTDKDGYASVPFTPPAPGDYVVTAAAIPKSHKVPPPTPVESLVCCREAGAPLIIVDLDKTLVASGFKKVLVGDPPPMPNSVEVMHELAGRFTVVYLTHRLDSFDSKTKAWLREHGYPHGPALLASKKEFLKGSGEYKTEEIEQLRRRFNGRLIGIGDQISDAQACRTNGAEALLLVHIPDSARAADLKRLAHALRSAPPDAQVVGDWREIRQALLEGARFPRQRFMDNLVRRAEELEIMKRVPEGR